MASIFDDVLAGGLSVFADVTAVPVQYIRGESTIDAMATPTDQRHEVPDAHGVIQVIISRDYLFWTHELKLSGVLFEPQKGDRITETIGGQARTHEVRPIAGKDCFEYQGPGQQMTLVRTKKVA